MRNIFTDMITDHDEASISFSQPHTLRLYTRLHSDYRSSASVRMYE